MNISEIVERQRELFLTGKTLSYEFRKQQLIILEKSIIKHTAELLEAFKTDLNKCEFDAVTTEISLAMQELRYQRKHLRRFMRAHSVRTTLPANNQPFNCVNRNWEHGRG